MALKTLFKPFQRLLLIIWKGFTAPKRNALTDIPKSTLLARYLTQSNHFNKTNVTLRAFMTALDKKTSVWETSTFHINGLDEASIWELGLKYVALPLNKPLYGRGDILEVRIEETRRLKVEHDNDPPRHAKIIGWPEEKHEQKSLAIDLAAEAKLKLKP